MEKTIKETEKGDFVVCKTFMNDGVKTASIDSFYDKESEIGKVIFNKEFENPNQTYEFFEVSVIAELTENSYKISAVRIGN